MPKNAIATMQELTSFRDANPDIEHLDAFMIDVNGNALGKETPRGMPTRCLRAESRIPLARPYWTVAAVGKMPRDWAPVTAIPMG